MKSNYFMSESINENNNNEISKNESEKQIDLHITKIKDLNFDLSNYEVIPIAKIGELGAIGVPIVEALEAISGAGGSGLYLVNTAGGTLFQCASKGAYIGGMTTATGEIGQAALTPVIFNPVSLCSTITMVSTMMKLDEISQNVKDILSLIDLNDRAVIKRTMQRLSEIMEQYKENANDVELLKIDLQEIRIKHLNDMIDIQVKYKDRVEELISENKSSKTQYKKLRKTFYYYEWATYLMCLCKFMLIGYEKKYDTRYLLKIKEDIKKYNDEIRQTYDDCYNYIVEHYDKSFVERLKQAGEFLTIGLSYLPAHDVTIIIPKLIGIFSKDTIHDKRIEGKEKEIKEIENTNKPELEVLMNKVESINKFYNEPFKMMVDKDSVYIEKASIKNIN